MAGRRKPSIDPREESIEELEWLRLTLTTIGGLYGEVISSQSWNTYAFLNGVLDDGSSPVDWLQGGAAVWLESLRSGAGFLQGIGSTLSRSLGPPAPQSGLYPVDKIEFYVDRWTQATDPVPTQIPLEQIDAVQVGASDGIPAECVNLSVGDHHVVYVALEALDTHNLPPSGPHDVELTWGRSGALTFTVHVA
jgi:hypothetical protein